jgi:hypothetical protein
MYIIEIAEKDFINPLYPPILGNFFITGGHPQTLGRKNPAPLSRLYTMENTGEAFIAYF